MVRLLPPSPADPRLLVVEITEDDIQKQKHWPLDDEVVAQLLEKLQQYQPKVIGLDLLRDQPQPPGSEDFLKQLQADNIIAIAKMDENGSYEIPPPSGVPKERIGFSDLVVDSDNVIRRNFMYTEQNVEKFYSFALRVSLKYLGVESSSFQVYPNALQIQQTLFPKLQPNSGGYQMPASEATGWQILLKYRSVRDVTKDVSLTDVLQGKLDSSWVKDVKDKVVLVGTTAPSAKDLFATPYSAAEAGNFQAPGVILHAQMVSQILSSVLDKQPQFWFWTQPKEWVWLWGWSLVGGILIWRLNHPFWVGLAVSLAAGGVWGMGWMSLWQSGWIPVIPPLLGLIGASGCVLTYKVRYSKFHDPLTGLPNRRLFTQKLQKVNDWRKLSARSLTIVLFLDLDRFKMINDSLGHQVGDRLLIETAQRIENQLKPQDQLARVGGDEFAIWLRSTQDVQAASQLAERLQQELTRPFFWQGQEIFTTVSIGIACHQTGENFRAEELLRYADIAMFRAKELGKARHQVFTVGMDAQVAKRWQLETDLRIALRQEEFQLHYQPIVSLKTLKIVGFEALVRWKSVQRGFVPPDEFISVIEDMGLIVPLGQWILQQACQQMSQWQIQFPHHPPLEISINLSSRQFSQTEDLVEQIKAILEQTGLQKPSLKLEITESMMIDNVEEAIAQLQRLKSLGLKLSIDDFGTGYSSLNYLHRFPVDALKVDKSFVSRIDATADSDRYTQIVRTIVMLSHNLNLEATAEGIETEAQLQILQALNCQYGQGYFFSRPLAADAAEALLSEDPQW
jgi:diguanylate cyclase (GGDEF)-like protein